MRTPPICEVTREQFCTTAHLVLARGCAGAAQRPRLDPAQASHARRPQRNQTQFPGRFAAGNRLRGLEHPVSHINCTTKHSSLLLALIVSPFGLSQLTCAAAALRPNILLTITK